MLTVSHCILRSQHLISTPFLWVDKEEALEKGVARLNVAIHVLGPMAATCGNSLQLPMKPIVIQRATPAEDAAKLVTSRILPAQETLLTHKALLSSHSMNLVYRIQHILFPALSQVQEELSAMIKSPQGGGLLEGGILPEGVGVRVTDTVGVKRRGGVLVPCL